MAGHTPGPWEIRDDIPYSVDGALIYSAAAGGKYGETICRIDNKHWPRAAENMALIKSAPDLARQLSEARKALDLLGGALAGHDHQWTPEERKAYERAMMGASAPV